MFERIYIRIINLHCDFCLKNEQVPLQVMYLRFDRSDVLDLR